MSGTYYPVPNCVQVDMIYDQEETTTLVENVYHVASTLPKDQTLLQGIEAVFESWENTTMKATRGTDVALLKIIVRDLSDPNGQTYTKGLSIAGTRAGTHLPNHNTFAIKWDTGRRGRSFRGRTYHIGIGLADLNVGDANTLDSTRAAALVTAYQALITNITTFGAQLVVVQRKSANAWINPPLTHEIKTATYSDLYIDSQRRRLPGHNRHR